MKIIKRYVNRRLYDSETSKTITLEDIAVFIKNGEQVKVVDNLTGEDITSKILGQVFLKVNLGGINNEFNIYLLTSLIKEGTKNIQGLFSRLIDAGLGLADLTPQKIEVMVDGFIRDGFMAAAEKVPYINDLFRRAALEADRNKESIAQQAQALPPLAAPDRFDLLSQKLEELSSAVKAMQEETKTK